MTNRSKTLLLILWVLILVLFSVTIHPGYKIYHSDQLIYYPAIIKALNPELYPNDLLLNFNQSQYTFFDELISWGSQVSNLRVIELSFIMFLLVKITFLLSLFMIARWFTKSYWLSYFLLLIFVSGSWIYGTTAVSSGNYLSPRFMSTALGVLFLTLYLHNYRILASLVLTIVLILHPISAIPFLACFYADVVWLFMKGRGFEWRTISSVLFPFVGLAVLLSGEGSGLELFSVMHPDLGRLSFTYISNWGVTSLTKLLIESLLCVVLYWEFAGSFESWDTERFFQLVLLVPAVIFGSNVIFSDVLNWQLAVQLQLYRSLVLWKIFLPLFLILYIMKNKDLVFADRFRTIGFLGLVCSYAFSFSYRAFPVFVFAPLVFIEWINSRLPESKIMKLVRVEPWWTTLRAILLLGSFTAMGGYVYLKRGVLPVLIPVIIILIALLIRFVVLQGSNRLLTRVNLTLVGILTLAVVVTVPGFSVQPDFYGNRNFMEICRWFRHRTSVDDVILAYPFSEDGARVRLACRRNVFWSRKGSAQKLFNIEFARKWRRRRQWINRLGENPAKIHELKDKYRINYVLSERELNIENTLAFRAEKYRIYNLSSTN